MASETRTPTLAFQSGQVARPNWSTGWGYMILQRPGCVNPDTVVALMHACALPVVWPWGRSSHGIQNGRLGVVVKPAWLNGHLINQ